MGDLFLINGERIKDLEFTVKKEDAFGQSKTVIRRGKKNYFVLNQSIELLGAFFYKEYGILSNKEGRLWKN